MTRGSVEVRRLAAPTRAEVERLATLFDRHRVHHGEVADASSAAGWLEENIGSGRLEAFVAHDGGELVGFATTMAVPASLRLRQFWEIRDLYVAPSHRRLGVARALLDCVRAAAVRAGALRLVVRTETDNTPALRLHARSG